VNVSGGLACFGEAVPAQALAQVCELVWQLRGQAAERRVAKARVGISANQGLFGHASAVIVRAWAIRGRAQVRADVGEDAIRDRRDVGSRKPVDHAGSAALLTATPAARRRSAYASPSSRSGSLGRGHRGGGGPANSPSAGWRAGWPRPARIW
jgi:hypothetical protein